MCKNKTKNFRQLKPLNGKSQLLKSEAKLLKLVSPSTDSRSFKANILCEFDK